MPPFQEKTLTEKQYPHPEPRLFSTRLFIILVPFFAGLIAAGLRTAAGAYLISHWHWPEAIAVAICLESAEVTFLLRWVWLKEQAKQDLFSLLGMALGFASSVSFSILLAFMAGERFSAFTQGIGQTAAIIASVGINSVTYLLGREIARYVIEHEVVHREWAEGKLRWQNRRISWAERKRQGIVQKESAPGPPQTRSEREAVMLRMYADKDNWQVSELCMAVGYKKTAMYAMRTSLVKRGLLRITTEGFCTNHQE